MGDRGDKAGRARSMPAAPAGQPLGRRRSIEPPPAVVTARHFFIREVGILAEQGVLDRARMLLARRSNDAPSEPEAYLDAMRFELAVPSSGAAWSAWMTRALKAAVPVATYIAKIVPERTLAPQLLQVRASAFLKQPDRASALDLLRLRAVAALLANDARALDVLEDDALEHAATDAELAALCMHVLAARAFAEPDHAERLATKLDNAIKPAAESAARAELRAAIALGRAYRSVTIEAPCPAPLERALGLYGRCDAGADRLLLADLERDLRAQPAPCLAWADAVAAAAPALIEAWLARFRGPSSAPAQSAATPRSDAVVRDAAAAIERDALRFLPLHQADQALYRKHVRPKALAAITDPAAGAPLAALLASTSALVGRGKRVLELVGSDPALALLDQLALTSASRGSDRETIARP
jgi:hypothetical protein